MRDLFTSPSVSFAYERGWRQGFAAAGFPGADKEFELANEYFAPVVAKKGENDEDCVLVDMSCATGKHIVRSRDARNTSIRATFSYFACNTFSNRSLYT